jgi:hypothetical protein
MSVSLQQPVDAVGLLIPGDDTAFLAVLVTQGAVKIVPNTNAAPWWNFSATTGSFINQRLTIPAAVRIITARTDQRSWSEGGADFYGETIAYVVQPTGSLASMSGLPPMTGQARLLLKKDASNDQWQVWYGGDHGTESSAGNDPANFVRAVVAAGSTVEDNLTSAIQSARAAASNQIAQSLANRGLFEESKTDINVIISRNNGIVYNTQVEDLHGGSYDDAATYCANQTVGNYHWRLPSIEELRSIVGADTNLIDVPDGRLWNGVVEGAKPGQAVFLVANTFVVNNGPELGMDAVNPADPNPYGWGLMLQINTDRSTFVYQHTVEVHDIRHGPAAGGDGSNLARVLCVAPIAGAAPAAPAQNPSPSGPLPKVLIPMPPEDSFQPSPLPHYDLNMHFDNAKKPR